MKLKNIIKVIVTAVLLINFSSCITDYDEPVIEELSITREFAPIDLDTRIRNQTSVELDWAVREGQELSNYVVEFSADDPDFNTIFLSQEVTADELPVLIRLEGETIYSIRVKTVSSRGLDDSTWALAEATTLSEQIMLPSEAGDIQALSATLRWEAGLNVTHFILEPGTIRYDISEQEKASGVATITELTPETDYTATLYNNDKVRGTAVFTTGIDIGDNVVLTPSDDIFQAIADADPGAIILFDEGDYTQQVGRITLDKSVTLRGLKTDFKPLLKVAFTIDAGAENVELIDLDLTGDLPTDLNDVVSYTNPGNFNSLLIKGCNIHDYNRSFVRGPTTDGILQSLTVENSIVSNILTSGGDFIDFRNGDVLNVNILNSTFDNCAPGRDFLRLDASGTSNGNSTINILIDSCTIHACSNSSSRRLLYVRFDSNDVTVNNTLIASTESEGYADRSGIDETPTFFNNNYWNAPGYIDSSQHTYDASGTHTELDPGFADAASGDFTLTNQDLIDNAVGDPRWRR